jgi:NAD(P)H dehydrogenase (quinone)
MPVYAVTGASGHLGRLAVQQLLARGVLPSGIVAVVRSRATVGDFAARGVHVREADYSEPQTMRAALAGVTRLLLVSSSEAGQRVVHHTNVIDAANAVRVSRILYTSMLNTDVAINPFSADHLASELALRESGVEFTLLRNGLYTDGYTDHLREYLTSGEIPGAAANGRISAATRQDFASAAAAALLRNEAGNPTYELGGPSFDLAQLARTISDVTGTRVTYRDLPVEQYVDVLQQDGLDQATARFVAAIDASIARGELETNRQDLAQLLGRPPTPLTEIVRAAYDVLKVSDSVQSS